MEQFIPISVHQLQPILNEPLVNVDRVIARMRTEAAHDIKLAVFPECMLTGYVFESRDQAWNAAMPAGMVIDLLMPICREIELAVCVGFLERDGTHVYNTAVLITPHEGAYLYRKVHLPPLGADRFIDPGNGPLTVVKTSLGCIGMLICYDMRFPEAALTLALQGAEIILMPTNWPEEMTANPDFTTRCRARDCEAYVVACDRWGVENGTRFLGRSQIVDPMGNVVAEAPSVGEATLHEELDLSITRRSVRVGRGPLVDRRADMYRL